jgi:hypothetical protein
MVPTNEPIMLVLMILAVILVVVVLFAFILLFLSISQTFLHIFRAIFSKRHQVNPCIVPLDENETSNVVTCAIVYLV